MLLDVGHPRRSRLLAMVGLLAVGGTVMAFALGTPSKTSHGPHAGSLPAASRANAAQGGQGVTPAPGGGGPASQTAPSDLHIVVLDPGHGGTDLGARGTGGIQESEITLEFAQQARRALDHE